VAFVQCQQKQRHLVGAQKLVGIANRKLVGIVIQKHVLLVGQHELQSCL